MDVSSPPEKPAPKKFVFPRSKKRPRPESSAPSNDASSNIPPSNIPAGTSASPDEPDLTEKTTEKKKHPTRIDENAFFRRSGKNLVALLKPTVAEKKEKSPVVSEPDGAAAERKKRRLTEAESSEELQTKREPGENR